MIRTDSAGKVVAIASSTGGPKALQKLIPLLPKELNAPVLLVQHMPAGFTEALASRLNDLSRVTVKEAEEGDILQKGCVYLARGGRHMNVVRCLRGHMIHYTDEPPREGVRPCANYMYESLADSAYEFDRMCGSYRHGCRWHGWNRCIEAKEKSTCLCAG